MTSDFKGPELPFARYRDAGLKPLGIPKGGDGTARHGYGPPVFEVCGYSCVYCGFDMSQPYQAWLNLSVDHVVPSHTVKSQWPNAWVLDLFNLVTCCRACNEFLNGYRMGATAVATTIEDFVAVRNRVFREKFEHAAQRHRVELERYQKARPAGPTDAQEAVEDAS